MSTIFKFILRILNIAFCTSSVILLICLLGICFDAIFNEQWYLQLDTEGYKNFQDFWSDKTWLLKGFLSCATIWIASYTLNRSLNISTINSLCVLREKFSEEGKKNFHLFLMAHSAKKEDDEEGDSYIAERMKNTSGITKYDFNSADVFDYLGIVELGAIMLKRGDLTFKEFYNQFGYRVEYLWQVDEIRTHIEKHSQYYEDFIDLIDLFKSKGKLE